MKYISTILSLVVAALAWIFFHREKKFKEVKAEIEYNKSLKKIKKQDKKLEKISKEVKEAQNEFNKAYNDYMSAVRERKDNSSREE